MKKYIFATVVAMALVAPQAGHATTIDTAALEGDTMTFTITLGAAPNGWAVRYKFKTVNGTAIASDDYTAKDGTVTFNSGVKQKKIYVSTKDDDKEEDPEIFDLKLDDQQVNGLYRDVTGWVSPTSQIRSIPAEIKLTGQILDNDASAAGRNNSN